MIVGIGLSTLHQSSLGSLFLIMPYRLHPLWYSPILPMLFLISAIALGLMMVMFESHFTAYLYRRKPETRAAGVAWPALRAGCCCSTWRCASAIWLLRRRGQRSSSAAETGGPACSGSKSR